MGIPTVLIRDVSRDNEQQRKSKDRSINQLTFWDTLVDAVVAIGRLTLDRPACPPQTLTTCERPELAQCFRALYPGKPFQALVSHVSTVVKRRPSAEGGGEQVVAPRVSSLFRCYSDPKTTTSKPRLHHSRHFKRRAIPSRKLLGYCTFLCVLAVGLSNLMVPSMLERQCSPLTMFSTVLESLIQTQ